MTTLELKNVLIKKISEIDDQSFLEALKTILEAKTESKILHLTPDIIDEIIKSKQEVVNGLFIENDLFQKEIEEWLNEK